MAASDQDRHSPLNIRSTKPDPERSPDIRQVDSIVLEEGPRARKEVVHLAIHSRNTGEFKGHKIGFRTRHRLQGIWQNDAAKSFTLETDDQVRSVVRFILAACGGSIPDIGGNFLVVPAPREGDTAGLQRVLTALSQDGKADLLVELLGQASRTPELFDSLMQQASSNPELFVEVAATLNLARYRRALEELDLLITTSNREHDFQRLLTRHPWMFGSEYSEHLTNSRILTRGAQQDFVLRRTADGYIEVVEIKTPLGGRDLFRFDNSHQSYYAGAELSVVIGQVQKYIEELDASRYEIKVRDSEDTNKIRAKIIIGRDGDEAQRQALRRFNGHLHRIEVLTFDQLRRIAGRVVAYLEDLAPHRESAPDPDAIPF